MTIEIPLSELVAYECIPSEQVMSRYQVAHISPEDVLIFLMATVLVPIALIRLMGIATQGGASVESQLGP
jgi:hypothetical protein